MKTKPNTCPDTCPVCWLDLKKEGYPFHHQHSATGDECEFSWEPLSALDPEWTDEA